MIMIRVWHLDFRLGARKGLLITLVIKNRISVLLYTVYTIVGPYFEKSRGICPWESRTLDTGVYADLPS